jgi:phage host-nuclease inhibitor protein Gam
MPNHRKLEYKALLLKKQKLKQAMHSIMHTEAQKRYKGYGYMSITISMNPECWIYKEWYNTKIQIKQIKQFKKKQNTTMAKSRQTKTIVSNITKDNAEDAFAEYAKADARIQQLTAKMDVDITKVREKYATELSDLGIKKEQEFDKMQAYATDNRQDFGNKKSMEFAHGVLGFRTGTPKLKTLKGFTWNSVTNLLKEFLPTYVRVVEEPAKDRLLADRDAPETNALFTKVGICVDQDETFFVEPKKEIA